MSPDKLSSKLKEVEYTRAFQSGRETPILLCGDSRWIRDLELLAEDEWRNLACCSDVRELASSVKAQDPRICVVECGAFGGSELRLIESVIPKNICRVAIAQEPQDPLTWRRLQRSLLPLSVHAIQLPSDASAALPELTQLLTDLLPTIHTKSEEEREHLRTAFSGFRSGQGNVRSLTTTAHEEVLLCSYRFLLSLFTLSYEQLAAALVLAETHAMYQFGDSLDGRVSQYYKHQLQILAGTPAEALLKVAFHTSRCFTQSGDVDQVSTERVVIESGLGALARRQVLRKLPDLRGALVSLRNDHVVRQTG